MISPRRTSLARRFLPLIVVAVGVFMGARFFPRSRPETLRSTSPAPAVPDVALASPRQNSPEHRVDPAMAEPPIDRETGQLAKLAATDPAQALAEALREADPVRRQQRVMAVLKAWAAVDPDAAAHAALAWPGSDRIEPVAAVLAGVAGRPADALRLGTFFCREDPGWAPEHGRTLINALSQAGQFSAAVSFALAGGAEVEGEERNKWLAAAFAGWAQREPQLAALAATSDLPATGMQQEALIAVVSNWRRLNPDGPEKFIAQLPAGPERTALTTALAATSGR
jgi:hypothetical protein